MISLKLSFDMSIHMHLYLVFPVAYSFARKLRGTVILHRANVVIFNVIVITYQPKMLVVNQNRKKERKDTCIVV